MTVKEIVDKRLSELLTQECTCATTLMDGENISVKCDRCAEIEIWQSKCTCNECEECLKLKIQELQMRPCECTYKTVIEQRPSIDENGEEIMIDVEVSVVDTMCARCIEIKGYRDTLDKWDALRKANIDKADYDKYDVIDGVVCSKVVESGKVSEITKLKQETSVLTYTTFDLDFRMMMLEEIVTQAQPSPMMARANTNYTMRGMMEMTPYQMAKKLILIGMYERADMEYKIKNYVKYGRMTQAEADELIALMDANELV